MRACTHTIYIIHYSRSHFVPHIFIEKYLKYTVKRLLKVRLFWAFSPLIYKKKGKIIH
jgi:hypothetical protein